MKKILFMITVISLLTMALIGCAEKTAEQELQDELAKLSPEEDAQLKEDINDDGEIAGQAFAGIARMTRTISAGKTECKWVCSCDGPASECCEYIC